MERRPTIDWKELAIDSHYKTAAAIKKAIEAGDTDEAALGIEELIEALSRSEKRALESHLIRLMTHILKWHAQPERRSHSWAASIRQARRAIARLQEDTPSLTRSVIEAMWNACLQDATDQAEAETNLLIPPTELSWEDVFETSYTPDHRS